MHLKMILLHNHPSENLFPSKEDCGITDRLLRLSGLLGIPIVDHIIVGGHNREYFSFHEHCLIENPVIKYASCCEDISMDRFGKMENPDEKTESCKKTWKGKVKGWKRDILQKKNWQQQKKLIFVMWQVNLVIL